MQNALFQWLKNNWRIESKTILWTSAGYSFIVSWAIKQVKGLELIPIAFGSCCCKFRTQGFSASDTSQQSVQKTNNKLINHGDRCNIMIGQSKKQNGMLWRKAIICEHSSFEKAWMFSKEFSDGWSQDLFHGKEKPLHSIQPKEEDFPAGKHIIMQKESKCVQKSTS